jgi:hypothetical protein
VTTLRPEDERLAAPGSNGRPGSPSSCVFGTRVACAPRSCDEVGDTSPTCFPTLERADRQSISELERRTRQAGYSARPEYPAPSVWRNRSFEKATMSLSSACRRARDRCPCGGTHGRGHPVLVDTELPSPIPTRISSRSVTAIAAARCFDLSTGTACSETALHGAERNFGELGRLPLRFPQCEGPKGPAHHRPGIPRTVSSPHATAPNGFGVARIIESRAHH